MALNEGQVLWARDQRLSTPGMTYAKLAEVLKVDPKTVWEACVGKRFWTELPNAVPTGYYKPTKEQIHGEFLSKVQFGKTEDDCWLWLGLKDKRRGKGYGYFNFYGHYRAHCWSYTYFKKPIPLKLHVCHTCDNPPCCNPKHLFLGTTKENAWDAKQKDRLCRGERSPRAKLTDKKVIHMRKLRATGRSYPQLAQEFGVALSLVHRVCTKQSWKHV